MTTETIELQDIESIIEKTFKINNIELSNANIKFTSYFLDIWDSVEPYFTFMRLYDDYPIDKFSLLDEDGEEIARYKLESFYIKI